MRSAIFSHNFHPSGESEALICSGIEGLQWHTVAAPFSSLQVKASTRAEFRLQYKVTTIPNFVKPLMRGASNKLGPNGHL
jgi:hypothetical protein